MFKRISILFRGFLGLFVSGIERENPEALLNVVQEDLRNQISRYNQGLATHAAMCEKLMTQVKSGESNTAKTRAQVAAHLKSGNTAIAGQLALQLQQGETQLAENKAQLVDAEATYKDLVKARNITIDQARAKIDKLKFNIGDMKVKKATAEMNEMAAGLIANIGGSGDTLNRLEEMVNEDREKAAGRARVAKDSLNTTDFQIKEAEQTALADQALADFAAKEGIALPSAGVVPDTGAAQRQMGGGDATAVSV